MEQKQGVSWLEEEEAVQLGGHEEAGKPVRVVHLRRAEIEDASVREEWQAKGYATMGPVEGHDPHQRCPICSTDEPEEDCPNCGQGPCILERLLQRL